LFNSSHLEINSFDFVGNKARQEEIIKKLRHVTNLNQPTTKATLSPIRLVYTRIFKIVYCASLCCFSKHKTKIKLILKQIQNLQKQAKST